MQVVCISIPYGAIKRRSKVVIYKVNSDISIPYGAIKRLALVNFNQLLTRFQFLMVRLKVIQIAHYFGLYQHFNSLWCD